MQQRKEKKEGERRRAQHRSSRMMSSVQSDSRLFIDKGGMKEQAAFKPTQAEMTLLLKEILMGKLTSFPTIEMGI